MNMPFPTVNAFTLRESSTLTVKVAMREIALSPTTHPDGRVEQNNPVPVYDTSEPWGDPQYQGDVTKGLPALRREWILARGDVEEYGGRSTQPEDNGYLSDQHAEQYNQGQSEKNRLIEYPGLKRNPLRAKKGATVTQMHYARQGIITPEMEYIAIRENLGTRSGLQNSPVTVPAIRVTR